MVQNLEINNDFNPINSSLNNIFSLNRLLNQSSEISVSNQNVFKEHFLSLLDKSSKNLQENCNFCLQDIQSDNYKYCSNCNIKLHYTCIYDILKENIGKYT